MKKSFVDTFVIWFSSIGLALLIGILVNIPMKFIFPNVDNSLLDGIYSVLIALIIMFCLSFALGYKNKKFEIKKIILSLALVFGFVFLLTVILDVAVYITGPTDHFATYIFEKSNPDLYWSKEAIRPAVRWRYGITLFSGAYLLIYSPLIILAQYLGAKKHKKDFDKLKPKQSKFSSLVSRFLD